MKKNFIKIFYVYFLLSNLCLTNFLYSGIDGTASMQFNSKNWVFNRKNGVGKAQGFVKFNNGFTILNTANGQLDICVPVSGPVDLRETGTMELLGDLHFESNVTLSSGGQIKGNSNTLFLDGDLTVTSVIHINGNTIINGEGNSIYFVKDAQNNYAQIFVDNNITLTLKNLTLKQLPYATTVERSASYPFVKLAGLNSKLALDNVVISNLTDYLFDKGQLYVYNDVLFTGTSALIYTSPSPSYIMKNSCLYFDKNTTFSFAPATLQSTAKDLINLTDKTSELYFDGCSLKTTSTGFRLTKGTVYFDNNVKLTSNTDNIVKTLSLRSTANPSYNGNGVSWHPSGQYLATALQISGNSLKVYSFNENTLTDLARSTVNLGYVAYCLAFSPDGKYLAVGGSNGTQYRIYKFNGSSLTFLINLNLTGAVGTYGYSLAWSPDGKYLAIGGNGFDIRVYRFDGTQLTLAISSNPSYGNICYSQAWSPDGKYLAIGGALDGSQVQVFSFNGNSLTQITTLNYSSGKTCYSVAWSPDGKYLAIGGDNTAQSIRVLSFDGSNLNNLSGSTISTYGNTCKSVSWSPNGKYLAIGGNAASNQIQVYNFDGSNLTLLPSTAINYGANCNSVQWNPNGKFLGIGGALASNQVQAYYAPFSSYPVSSQSQSNGITFGNSALGPYYDTDVIISGRACVETNGILKDDSY